MEFDWSLSPDGGCYINGEWQPYPNGYCRVKLPSGAELRLTVWQWQDTGLYRWSGSFYALPGEMLPAARGEGNGLPTMQAACRAAESWAKGG